MRQEYTPKIPDFRIRRVKSVIPVVVSDESAIISDNQEHLTKIHGKLVTIMIWLHVQL